MRAPTPPPRAHAAPSPRAADPVQMRFAPLPDGGRIAWARSGHGPPLVRLSHWLSHVERESSTAIWRPWVDALAARCTLLRYDGRGQGLSSAAPPSAGLDEAVADLAAAVDASGEPRVTLLGISGAAPVALAYAVQRPERVAGLVLLGGYLAGLLCREGTTQSARDWFEAQLTLMALGWGRGDGAVQQFFTTVMLPDASAEEARALIELQRVACSGPEAAHFARQRATFDVRALAPQVRCPALVLHGEGDRVVPHALGQELAAAIPGARFETLRTRNHVPTPGDPAFGRVFAALDEFLARPAAPPLAPRERELAHWVALGLDNLQIAARMGLAEKTVRNALSALYLKLQVEGRPQAVVRTRELGLDRPTGTAVP